MLILKSIIKLIFFKLGFTLPQRIIEPIVLLNNIQHKPEVVQFYELKQLANFAAAAHQQKYYNNLLLALIPSYSVNEAKSFKFIGSGAGKFIFNSYRRINTQSGDIFEKVYFNKTGKFKRLKWFYKNYFNIASNEFRIPLITNLYDGDIVSVVNFEFLKLKEIPFNEKLQISLTKKLYSVGLNADLNTEGLPDYLYDYKSHNAYAGYFKIAKRKLETMGIDIALIESKVTGSEHVFTHGDIHNENIFQNNTLIDWDFFGYYPIGFELAQMYCQMLSRKQKNYSEDPSMWLENNYREFYSQQFLNLKYNFIFFLFVFCQTLFVRNKCLPLEDKLRQMVIELQSKEV